MFLSKGAGESFEMFDFGTTQGVVKSILDAKIMVIAGAIVSLVLHNRAPHIGHAFHAGHAGQGRHPPDCLYNVTGQGIEFCQFRWRSRSNQSYYACIIFLVIIVFKCILNN